MARRHLNGDGRRARIGIVVPSVNTVMEPWAHKILPDGVSLFAARMFIPPATTPEAFIEMDRNEGKAAIRQALSDRFKQIPDMRWEGQDYILAGDQAVSLWIVRGKGADGEELNYQGCDIYRFEGDKIVDKNTFWKIVEHQDRL